MNTWHVVAALAGALTWSFLEYVIHRWLGHDRRFRKSFFAMEHIRHHSVGDYFAPAWKKLVAAVVVGTALGVPSALVAGSVGVAFTLGLLVFYGCYETLHGLMHVTGGIGPYGRWARRHHFTHHFEDPKANHGVTSPLWDVVFGTYRKPSTITVPRKLCMRWLKGKGTEEVRPDWAGTFILGGR